MAPKVLFVLTSHNKLGDTGHATGWYLPEFAHPYDVLSKVAAITVASPRGGEAPLDPSSVEAFKADDSCQNFLKNHEALWKSTQPLSNFVGKAGDFDALFYVGGHGPMFDLAEDKTSHDVIREFWEAGKVVSAVCHGPAALVNVRLGDGSYLIAGQEVTGFSNVEEEQVGLMKAMPFALESSLAENSRGHFAKAAEPWGEKVCVSGGGRLITGQNPASATGIGKAIQAAIKA